MRRKRWLKVVSGAAAILLVVAAVVWVVAPDQSTPTQTGRTLNAAGASAGLAGSSGVAAQEPVIDAGPVVILPDKADISPALRDIAPIMPKKTDEILIRWNEMELLPSSDKVGIDAVDPNLQDWQGKINMPAPLANWEGTSNVSGVLPPDTQGDVGPNHYVQWVNLAFTIYNKSGTALYGPANGNTIWTGFDTICANNNDGDPITLYDHLADRWFMSQFILGSTSYQCIAVSQTSDPTGSWYRYRYTWPNSYMNDYPHFGMWPDAYYLTVNQFNSSGTAYTGAGVAAFERTKMLTGATAQMVYFNLGTSYGGQLPADWEGSTQPASGAPGLILEWDDSTTDYLRIWQFDVDWTTPANSTWTLSYNLQTTNVDSDLCTASRERCVPQPGTTYKLEAIADRLMHRVQYRNFGGYQTLVGNHTVDVGSGRAGIHWFEVRNTGSTWSIYQQGTYGPADGLYRWMGSIAMDGGGNIALGYSVSDGTSTYPGIRYVGRLATDTLGTLPQGETVLIAGGGSQTYSTYGRWGDYSALQIDPSDDSTFWYTQEYYATTSTASWKTRIGSFKFSNNHAPVANPQSVTTDEDIAVPITLTGSDSDGDTLSFTVQTSPSHGTLSGTAPALTYTPAADYNGADSFTFIVNDGQANSAAATVSITVNAVNDVPVANAQSVTTQQNTPVAITLTGSDVEGAALTYAIVTGPVNGILSGSAPNLTYTPTSGYTGADSFTFKVNDGALDSAPATVSITVMAVNHAPVANPQSVTTNEDIAVLITLTGSDSDGNPLTYSVTSQPSHGTLSGTAPALTYTPAANYNGADSFTFVANDGLVDSDPATVSITVNAVNDVPVANAQSVTTQQNTPVAITLTGSDVEGAALTYAIVTGPVNGILSGSAPNLTYTPTSGYTGADSFTFKVNDGALDSSPATVSITVTPAGDVIWMSLSANATLGTLGTVNDEDIVALNKATGVYSWVFDGSDVGITGDIDAFDVLDNGHILMSFDASTSVTGIGTVADSDIVEFTPTSTGSTTAGTFTWKFDASDVGLAASTQDSEDVDAVFFLSDGTMLVSTRGNVSVTGVSGTDADLIKFTATSWGSTTAGAWSWYFDASDVGLSTSNEDVDGLWVDQAITPYPYIYLNTLGAFSVTGVSGANEDIFIFKPTALGSTTAGTFGTTLYLDGSLFSLSSYDIDAFDVRR